MRRQHKKFQTEIQSLTIEAKNDKLRKRERKRKESINQRLKQREIEKNKKGFFDPTISEQCAKLPKEKKYKREAMITWLKPGGVKRSPTLVTN